MLENSPVVIRFDPEENSVEANLVSKMRIFFVEQHIQNQSKSVSGKFLKFGSFHISAV